MDKITEKQIEKQAELEYREFPTEVAGSMYYNKDVHCFNKRKAFIKGANWMQEQMKCEWTECNFGDSIENGDYFFGLRNGNIEDVVFARVAEGKVPYFMSTHYIKVSLPKLP